MMRNWHEAVCEIQRNELGTALREFNTGIYSGEFTQVNFPAELVI